MKFTHSLPLVLVLTLGLPGGLSAAAEDPKAVLESIIKLRTDRLAAARTEGKRPAASLYQADVLAKAKAALEGVDPAKVDLANAAAWQELFVTAQDFDGARTLTERWAAGSQGEEKFKAQMALVTLDARDRNYTRLRKTLMTAQPPDTAGRVRLASLANSYVVNVLTNENRAAALELLATGEKALPSGDLSEDRHRQAVQRARENLASTRKVIEENPGKEAEALQKSRRAQVTQALGRTGAGTNAAGASSTANLRAERDAKLAKLNGTPAPDFKAAQTIGSFTSLGDLKGKVVLLDFFAHWCGPCIASFPSLHELYDDLKPKGFEVVGMTRHQGFYKGEYRATRDMPKEKEFEKMQEFVSEHKMNWPVAFVEKKTWDDYMCSAIPHVVLVDRKGTIRKVKVGFNKDGAKAFREEVEKLVAE